MIEKVSAQTLFEGVDTSTIDGVSKLIGNAIQLAAAAAGIVSVIFIIVGAIQYISSGGGDGVKKAKTTISFAVAGLALSISAYGIVQFLVTNIGK